MVQIKRVGDIIKFIKFPPDQIIKSLTFDLSSDGKHYDACMYFDAAEDDKIYEDCCITFKTNGLPDCIYDLHITPYEDKENTLFTFTIEDSEE